MSSNKQFVLKSFKTVFENYLEYIENNIESQKTEVSSMKQIINLMLTFNKSGVLKIWFNYITVPYGKIILSGNYDFFIDKNYNKDLKDMDQSNVSYILNTLEETKRLAKNIDKEKKKKIMEFNQQLTKLSIMYFNN
jgi:hypothetical protein